MAIRRWTDPATSDRNFYDRYYFRPKVIYRIMKRSLTSTQELRRRYREGKEFLQLRSDRREFARA